MKPAPIKEKYNLNLYDTVVAWAISDYVAAHKDALESVVAGGKLDGKELVDHLDAAVSWVKKEHRDCEEKLVGMIDAALDGFDGTRYVQAMDAGFAEYVLDLYGK